MEFSAHSRQRNRNFSEFEPFLFPGSPVFLWEEGHWCCCQNCPVALWFNQLLWNQHQHMWFLQHWQRLLPQKKIKLDPRRMNLWCLRLEVVLKSPKPTHFEGFFRQDSPWLSTSFQLMSGFRQPKTTSQLQVAQSFNKSTARSFQFG